MYDIVVLGAGVVGLSTAVNLQTHFPDREVTIIADKFNTETTSDGAAGIFSPSDTSVAVSLSQYKKWLIDSYSWFHDLYATEDPAVTGIQRISGYQFTSSPKKFPIFHDVCYHFRHLTEKELQSFPGNQKFGWMFTTLMIECRKYLLWLTKKFTSNGGKVIKKTVKDISEFSDKCTVLINCCGLRAGQLFNDKDVFPLRGHTIRVKAPWIKHFVVDEETTTYIYPGQDYVVLGGTRQKNEYDVTPSEYWTNDIIGRCETLSPGIKNAEVVAEWVGLRPCRTKIKVKMECLKNLKIVHNYGHGANGIALSWGTAIEATNMVKDVLSSSTQSKL
ncbi:hypothetical protein ACF0H5_006383 [Mactra antiquata]